MKRRGNPRRVNNRIYLSPPQQSDGDLGYILEALESNWIAPLGPNVDAFEREFCTVVGAEHSLALNSGTAGLHLALKVVGVEAGDEVWVSTLTFAASVFPILYLGATPVFVDSERTSWNMDPNLLEQELKRRAVVGKLPKAVILVHIYGQSADIDAISSLCNRYNIALIEDAAEALGAKYKGRSPGVDGQLGIFSFNGNKIITTSGGGMLVSNNSALIQHARKLSTQAREPVPHYEHTEIGFNYRMSNILAGMGRGQLQTLQDRVSARRANFAHYQQELKDLPGIQFMPEAPWGLHSRWLSCILLDQTISRVSPNDIRLHLETLNIESRNLWKPMHQQPIFERYEAFGGEVADQFFTEGMCLPSGSTLTPEDLYFITDEMNRFVTSNS